MGRRGDGKRERERQRKVFLLTGDGCDFMQASVSINTFLKSKQCPSDLYASAL